MESKKIKTLGPVAIIGTGPSALMAATYLIQKNPKLKIHLFEKRKSPGRKLLIAGSSGLNISWSANSIEEFLKFYKNDSAFVAPALEKFQPAEWLSFIETLGHKPFIGTSKRIFVADFKGASFLKSWTDFLKEKGVEFFLDHEFEKISKKNSEWEITFKENKKQVVPILILALGGGSWEETLPSWPKFLEELDIEIKPFESANAGFDIDWKKETLEKLSKNRVPAKNILFSNKSGSHHGDILFTEYGLEGTPIYHIGSEGKNQIDLLPQFSREQIEEKIKKLKENFAPFRALKKLGILNPDLQDILYHEKKSEIKTIEDLIHAIKNFEINLKQKRPLKESISSLGGVSKTEINPQTMELLKHKNLYCIGEMLDWHAPTGGFLIQACVSQGALAAISILNKQKS